jgi:hypothetical protein
MQLVTFQVKLSNLGPIDAVAGTFQARSVMHLSQDSHACAALLAGNACQLTKLGVPQATFDFSFHWKVKQAIIRPVSVGPDGRSNCVFLCDVTKPFCCDEVWVPRLRIANANGPLLHTSVLVPYNTAKYPDLTDPRAENTAMHWSVHVEGCFNFELDDASFPLRPSCCQYC